MQKIYKISYIDAYLAIHDKTRYDVSQRTGIPESTLSNAANNKNGSDSLSVAIIRGIARTVERPEWETYRDLMVIEVALEDLNRNKHFQVDSKVYWTLINNDDIIWKDEQRIKSTILLALTNWLDMDITERSDDEFYKEAWSIWESDDDFYESDKNGNRIDY